MHVLVEVYLRDHIIRGEVSPEGRRTLDIFNARGPAVALTGAQAASFHTAESPRRVGNALLDKRHILLVAPNDGGTFVPAGPRCAWTQKLRVHGEAVIGPLVVKGTFHLWGSGGEDPSAFFAAQGDDEAFLVATDATIGAGHLPGWSVRYPTVFIPRRAIGYLAAVGRVEDRTLELTPRAD